MKYHRYFQNGGTYFFTLVTFRRKKIFLEDSACELFMHALDHVQSNHPFHVIAYCLCPDHIHMIWSLPENDNNYPLRWRLVKSNFSRKYKQEDKESIPVSRKHKGECTVWQRRYWEHFIRDENDLVKHIEYIHFNPVKHALVDAPVRWRYSSFYDYVDQGLYQKDWGMNGDFGYLNAFGHE